MAADHDILSDHDILIGLQRDMCWVRKQLENHLRHHFLITLCSLSAALSAITAIVVVLLRSQ